MSLDLTKKIKNRKYAWREIIVWLLIRLLPLFTYLLIIILLLLLAWFAYDNIYLSYNLSQANNVLNNSMLEEQLNTEQLKILESKIKQ